MKNITNVFYEFLIALCCLMSSSALWAWEDMSMPRLHVEGRYLVDPHGNKVNLAWIWHRPIVRGSMRWGRSGTIMMWRNA